MTHLSTKHLIRLTAISAVMLFFLPRSQAETIYRASCDQLLKKDFSRTQDASFAITKAKIVSAVPNRPFCEVEGYVVPEISFQMRLPLTGWNHHFILLGSGGWASRKFDFFCAEPMARGYACIMGDGGHQYDGGLWMQSNPQTKIDWGYRATHVVAIAGKMIVKAFFGALPDLSLMMGVSTGGYQGLVEAQRFPWDFDGIIAVAPDIDEADLSMRTAWIAKHLVNDAGALILTTKDLTVLHNGALQACDISDNLQDGIIGDPLNCHFAPKSVLCEPLQTSDCLSDRQVAAAIAIYGGPTTSSGTPISTGGPFPGSEMQWLDALEDVKFAENFFRFALTDSPLDGFSASKFNYDEDYKRLGLGGTFISSNPDLRKFKQAGGKLLIVQGYNDVTEQARSEIDYYEALERVMGGAEPTLSFARLFLIPGMNDGSGGDGAFAIDYLAAMELWAADNIAPAVLIGAHVPEWEDGNIALRDGMTAPKQGMKTTFTRPVYPFPMYAAYKGSGSADDAGSFGPVQGR